MPAAYNPRPPLLAYNPLPLILLLRGAITTIMRGLRITLPPPRTGLKGI